MRISALCAFLFVKRQLYLVGVSSYQAEWETLHSSVLGYIAMEMLVPLLQPETVRKYDKFYMVGNLSINNTLRS